MSVELMSELYFFFFLIVMLHFPVYSYWDGKLLTLSRCSSFLISSPLCFFFLTPLATLSTLPSLFVLCPRPVLCCIVPPMYPVQKTQIFIKVQIFKWRKWWLFLVSSVTPAPAEMKVKRYRQLYSNPRTCTNTRYATMRVLSRCCVRTLSRRKPRCLGCKILYGVNVRHLLCIS